MLKSIRNYIKKGIELYIKLYIIKVKNMVKLQYDSNKQFKITLPKPLAFAKGWEKGDEIDIFLDEAGNIVLKKRAK